MSKLVIIYCGGHEGELRPYREAAANRWPGANSIVVKPWRHKEGERMSVLGAVCASTDTQIIEDYGRFGIPLEVLGETQAPPVEAEQVVEEPVLTAPEPAAEEVGEEAPLTSGPQELEEYTPTPKRRKRIV